MSFWTDKRVLVTGHTGFKGQWLAKRLIGEGALVAGFSLPTDIRDVVEINSVAFYAKPEIVFHLAAQSLVKWGLDEPLDTFSTNVMGTANLLDGLRTPSVKAIVVVTSDKVYPRGYGNCREIDPYGGDDPYSGSKVCAEIISKVYRETYGLPIVTARCGNVVGGGDYHQGRLIPDTWRALKNNEPLKLRAPDSTRPWTYVEDVIEGYMLYAEARYEGKTPTSLNFGPKHTEDPITALEAATLFASELGKELICEPGEAYREARHLSLDSSLARSTLGWAEAYPGPQAIIRTARDYAL